MKAIIPALFLGTMAASLLAACGGGSTPAPAAATTQAVTLNFDVVNGASAVGATGCASTLNLGNAPASGVTPAGTNVRLQDLRYYVSNVNLINAAGSATPITMTENNNQSQNVALMDFENAQGSCAVNNSVATYTAITGTVPAGNYTGVSFTVGVPETYNHTLWSDLLTPAPLQNMAMAWSWASGRKFTKIEVTIPAVPAVVANPASGVAAASAIPAVTTMVHLGSTGCAAVAGSLPNTAFTCTSPNRMDVKFATGFNPATNKIALDMGSLFGGLDMRTRQTWMSAKPGMAMPGMPAGPAAYFHTKFNIDVASGVPLTAPQTLFVVK